MSYHECSVNGQSIWIGDSTFEKLTSANNSESLTISSPTMLINLGHITSDKIESRFYLLKSNSHREINRKSTCLTSLQKWFYNNHILTLKVHRHMNLTDPVMKSCEARRWSRTHFYIWKRQIVQYYYNNRIFNVYNNDAVKILRRAIIIVKWKKVRL